MLDVSQIVIVKHKKKNLDDMKRVNFFNECANVNALILLDNKHNVLLIIKCYKILNKKLL